MKRNFDFPTALSLILFVLGIAIPRAYNTALPCSTRLLIVSAASLASILLLLAARAHENDEHERELDAQKRDTDKRIFEIEEQHRHDTQMQKVHDEYREKHDQAELERQEKRIEKLETANKEMLESLETAREEAARYAELITRLTEAPLIQDFLKTKLNEDLE